MMVLFFFSYHLPSSHQAQHSFASVRVLNWCPGQTRDESSPDQDYLREETVKKWVVSQVWYCKTQLDGGSGRQSRFRERET